MYVNLVLGILVLAAVIWLLVIYNRKDESPRDMLADEISKRRSAQETARKAQERLARLRHEHLAGVERGLSEMRQGLDEQGLQSGLMRWQTGKDSIILHFGEPKFYTGEAETDVAGFTPNGSGADLAASEHFIIRWNVRSVDMDLLASSEPLSGLHGYYEMIWPDGSVTAGGSLQDFLRAISAVIADRLA